VGKQTKSPSLNEILVTEVIKCARVNTEFDCLRSAQNAPVLTKDFESNVIWGIAAFSIQG